MPGAAGFSPASFRNLDDASRQEFWATLALRHTQGIGRRTIVKLLKGFGSAYEACRNITRWTEIGVDKTRADSFLREGWRTAAREEWEAAAKSDCEIVLWPAAVYPSCLRELTDAPPLLYSRGLLSLLPGPCIAVVGTRTPTRDGRILAETFGKSLSMSGITVVSGMALGIDRYAHKGALAGAGRSIGVLGTGIDWIYPRSNADIFELMGEDGLLVSEFPPLSPPVAANFPIRNRIISGLSLGVLVVEAATKSGSLLTARLALEQDREVFAVPGQALNPHYLGCQNLVRQGARSVFNADDILQDLAPVLKARLKIEVQPPAKRLAPPSDTVAQPPAENVPSSLASTDAQCETLLCGDTPSRIIALLRQRGILSLEEIVAESDISLSDISAALLGLEMTGQIIRHPGARIEAV